MSRDRDDYIRDVERALGIRASLPLRPSRLDLLKRLLKGWFRR